MVEIRGLVDERFYWTVVPSDVAPQGLVGLTGGLLYFCRFEEFRLIGQLQI
jgi:hypothetical protein